MDEMSLGHTGPAQSENLYHFTERNRRKSPDVDEKIRKMTPRERLESILSEERLRSFPFSINCTKLSGYPGMPDEEDLARMPRTRCVCFSEVGDEHLRFLINNRRYKPWAVVTGREAVLGRYGGAVAYQPEETLAQLVQAGLGHLAVQTSGPGHDWMHEREWRLPTWKRDDIGLVPEQPGARRNPRQLPVKAVLVGDPAWRPPAPWDALPVWVWDHNAGDKRQGAVVRPGSPRVR